jgi:ATP-dependent Zn protease
MPSASPGLAERAEVEVVRILKDAEQTALETLGKHSASVEALAKALVERETVEKAEVDAIVAEAERTPVAR